MNQIIDAHIHLDKYEDVEIAEIAAGDSGVEALISVSMNIDSCKKNLLLSEKYPKVKPAFGYHPEQPLPNEEELDILIGWMNNHHEKMVAVGEVGLPFFLRADNKVSSSQYGRYVELLEVFIKLAKRWNKPIALHAVYSDAPAVCDLLERYSFSKAHFHWFKGDSKTTERMIENGYFVSVTPEVAMEDQDNVKLVGTFPMDLLMVETDGPWPFEGPFTGERTNPVMIKESLKKIAEIKKISLEYVFRQIHDNTKKFYEL